MTNQMIYDFGTKTIKGMAGEPIEIPVYFKYEPIEITKEEFMANTEGCQQQELFEFENQICEDNHASAVNWVK